MTDRSIVIEQYEHNLGESLVVINNLKFIIDRQNKSMAEAEVSIRKAVDYIKFLRLCLLLSTIGCVAALINVLV